MNCPRITAYGGPRGFDQRMGIEKMSMPGRNKDAPRNPGIDKGLRRLITKKSLGLTAPTMRKPWFYERGLPVQINLLVVKSKRPLASQFAGCPK